MTFSPYANHQNFRLAVFEAMPAFTEAKISSAGKCRPPQFVERIRNRTKATSTNVQAE
tara:strand:+ start:998 stop:1171 length:174 start_codon:yes stop_codon:yes gene_type:complete